MPKFFYRSEKASKKRQQAMRIELSRKEIKAVMSAINGPSVTNATLATIYEKLETAMSDGSSTPNGKSVSFKPAR
ncbi:hypothetical protein HFO56_01900 [Rhizobium laguerreae]|uniref:hypothetical protein n=1 Tax=Rhizobium laguerreae TaxID=1076926 RepID=UPI001C92AC6F|nr:hypothetical protein [Rhizobium laguerreae]MBY3151160.1 hypothetical protein [Rhizobium laguerreae]